jgi:hypothetical protein
MIEVGTRCGLECDRQKQLQQMGSWIADEARAKVQELNEGRRKTKGPHVGDKGVVVKLVSMEAEGLFTSSNAHQASCDGGGRSLACCARMLESAQLTLRILRLCGGKLEDEVSNARAHPS